MSDVVSDHQYVLGQESPHTDDTTDNKMKGEQRNGYQHRPESPSSGDSDGYIQQPKVRHQSNTKQAPTRRFQPLPYASARYERYEGDPPTLQDREMKGRAILVKFYKDDDRLHRGVTVSINDRQFKTVESLCEYLNKKIDTKMGVRHIFNLRTKKEVKSVKELERGDVCVVSSSMRFKKDVIMYNLLMDQPISPTKSLTQSRSSREQGRATHERAQFNDSRTPNSTAPNKQVTFTIISNTDRYSKEKMILNPNTSLQFEQILDDMGGMLQLKYPPATGIFSARKPYQQIYSFSQLNREVKMNDCFFVCGKERYPEELGVTDTNEESFSEAEPEPEPVRKSRKEPPANKITPLKRRNEPSTDQNQKENLTPQQRGRAGKEPKKAVKTPRYEAESRRQPTKGNKTSRFEEDNEYSNRPKYGEDESKTSVRTSRQQDQPQSKKPNKSSPRFEEKEQRKPNKNFQQQQQQQDHGRSNGHSRFEDEEDEEFDRSRDSDLKDDDLERAQNGEPSSEEDDDDDMTSYPETSRTRKQQRMETPEY